MGRVDGADIDQEYPEPTVGGLIFNAKGELLIVKSHKWQGMYTIPGGHVEVGERLVDALHREVREETSLEVDQAEFLCYQEYIAGESFWEKRHFIFFDFVCRTQGQDVILNDEAQEYVWILPREALTYPIDPYLRHAIEVYLEKHGNNAAGAGV